MSISPIHHLPVQGPIRLTMGSTTVELSLIFIFARHLSIVSYKEFITNQAAYSRSLNDLRHQA
jgi:hypothetical protein